MCAEMTKTYIIIIGLRQLLFMCKAEKTKLNDRVATGGFCAQRAVADKVQKIETKRLLCSKGNWIYYTINTNKP